jgi:hypothetical protein
MAAGKVWHINIWHYDIDDTALMREIVHAAGVPPRVQVTRRGDVRGTDGYTLTDPEWRIGADPDWLVRIRDENAGENLGDYLRTFVRRYLGTT